MQQSNKKFSAWIKHDESLQLKETLVCASFKSLARSEKKLYHKVQLLQLPGTKILSSFILVQQPVQQKPENLKMSLLSAGELG